MKAVELAIIFHTIYEKLAPNFGYETRDDTKIFDIDSQNGKLMIATCDEILKNIVTTTDDIYDLIQELTACLDECMELNGHELPSKDYNDVIDRSYRVLGKLNE